MREQSVQIEHDGRTFDVAYSHVPRGGTTIVCLHDLHATKDMFEPLQPFFTRKKYSTVAIDCVGFGKSSKPEDFSYDLGEQAAILDKVIHAVKLNKFCIIGHGMGGMIGTMLLESWRSSILEFVNMEGGFTLDDCGDTLPVSQASFEEFSKALYPQLLAALETSPEPGAVNRRKWLRSTPDYVFHRTAASIVEWCRNGKVLSQFVDSSVSRVFVFGEKSVRTRDVLPSAVPSVKIPHAGHFLLAENFEATVRALDDFLL